MTDFLATTRTMGKDVRSALADLMRSALDVPYRFIALAALLCMCGLILTILFGVKAASAFARFREYLSGSSV